MPGDRRSTRIAEEDAYLIAADAAQKIVRRAHLGGTDAMTYSGIRDQILESLQPLVIRPRQRRRLAGTKPG